MPLRGEEEQQGAQTAFFVSGLWCGSCARSAVKAVEELSGVRSAHLDLTSRILLCTHSEPPASNLPRSFEVAVCRCLSRLGFVGQPLGPGWLQQYRELLAQEGRRTISPVRLGLVAFFAMWSSMWALAGYLGPLSPQEALLLAKVSTAFGLPAILLGVVPFLEAGVRALRSARRLTLDLFIGLGGLSAGALSLNHLMHGRAVTYVDSASMVLLLLLLAKLWEGRLAARAAQRLLAGSERFAPSVALLRGESPRIVEAHKLRVGDRVRVEPGATVPVDGRLFEEDAELDEHLLSGESTRLVKRPGEQVWAGSVAHSELLLEVTGPVGARRLDGWAESALLGSGRNHRYSDLLERWEGALTGVALTGASALALWHGVRGQSWEQAAMAFWIGTLLFCPCLFATILPLAGRLARGALGRHGILLWRGGALFDLPGVTCVAFDKTGTLEAVETRLDHAVAEGGDLTDLQRERLQALLRCLRVRAPHPLLVGLELTAPEATGRRPEVVELIEEAGLGVRGVFDDGQTVAVGKASAQSLLFEEATPLGPGPPSVECPETWVVWNGRLVARVLPVSRSRQGARLLIAELQADGLTPVVILSGDPDPEPAGYWGGLSELGIRYRGGLSPQEKVQHLPENALFVGDGLNDTQALTQARVSCRVGRRAEGIGAADVEIPAGDLRKLLLLRAYAVRYLRVLQQTAGLALVYNLTAWTLAFAGAFTPLGAVCAMLGSFCLMLASLSRLRRLP